MSIRRKRIPKDAVPAKLLETYCADILAHPNMASEVRCIQHGSTSVLAHSAAVAATAIVVARELQMPVDAKALARAALLHDYFLYDWHVPDPSHRLHGFTHPYVAARNALRDYRASGHEQAIIRTHMFPFTPLPPTSREAWLVCLVDSALAAHETLNGLANRLAKSRL